MPLIIPVVIDNKDVGENLQDHLMTGISFEVNDGVMTGDSFKAPRTRSDSGRHGHVPKLQGRTNDRRRHCISCFHAYARF